MIRRRVVPTDSIHAEMIVCYNAASMNWSEPLPPDCPPAEAWFPQHEQYYRLVDTIPPKEQDFHSLKELNPGRTYGAIECCAHAVSLIKSYGDCVAVNRLPKLRHKSIVAITLPPDSGAVLKTFKGTHHSWWRAKGFDAVPSWREVNSEDVR